MSSCEDYELFKYYTTEGRIVECRNLNIKVCPKQFTKTNISNSITCDCKGTYNLETNSCVCLYYSNDKTCIDNCSFINSDL